MSSAEAAEASPAGEETQTFVFDVEMVCGGCSGAVTRILNKIDEVVSVDANLEAQTVTVQATPGLTQDDVLAKLQKWGKAANKAVAVHEG